MPQHIGNAGTKAMAWAGCIMLSLSPQAERGKELEKFTERVGLLAHKLTHAIQQTQSQRLPQHQLANRDSSPAPAALTRAPSDAGMVLPAPAENTPLTTKPVRRKAQARASEQLAAEGSAEKRSKSASRIDVGEVADRVYRLMQHDLILERERATKLGG